MQHYYYLNSKNKKDGPHDLVTIMRRVRTGIIQPDTLVSEQEKDYVPAHTIEDLSHFFNRPIEDIRSELSLKSQISFYATLSKGWQFVIDHQNMTVFAGGLLLLSALVGMLAHEILRSVPSAITAAWITFMLLQNCFFAVSLRLYRGQKTDLEFIEHTLAPILGKVAFVSVIFSFLVILGFGLLIVPSIVIMLICAYMPMLIFDYDYSIGKTIRLIFSLLQKLDALSMVKLGILTFFYMVGIILIFPIPLVMPVMAGSLCSVYEELSNS